MKITMKGHLYAGLITAVLLVVLISFISYTTFRNENRQARQLKKTYQILNKLEILQKNLFNMETGRRGFRSTNELKFLEPYNSSLPTIQPVLSSLSNDFSANAQQLENLQKLTKRVNAILSFWERLGLDASGYTRTDFVRVNGEEKVLMDAIRREIQHVEKVEKEVLVQRERSNDALVKRATYALVIGISLILVIVLVLIFLVFKEFDNRKKAETDLKNKNRELNDVYKESTERNWLLAGVAEVNNKLQASEEIQELTQSVLDTIVRYLNMEAGAFYIFDSEKNSLALTAANNLLLRPEKVVQLHEGLVGQATLKKDVVVIKNLPNDYYAPAHVVDHSFPEAIYLPVHLHQEPKGVIELISLQAVEKQQLHFLRMIRDNIAVAIQSAQSREKVMALLKQVQAQAEVLENQQEELKQAYEDLSLQTETLQASEEELRVQEEELRQINAELEERTEAVETARQALQFKAKELEVTGKYKSQFLANMSHELRTPLNSILILAKLLAQNTENTLSHKQMEQAKIIFKSGSDLLELINDILDISKIEAGKVELNIEQVTVKEIANDLEQLFAVVALEKNINFSIKIDNDVPLVLQTDKQRIEQVLKNLLSNAFKFTPENGHIRLSFSCRTVDNNPAISISVLDTGIGISADKQKVIFEAFQQADGSTSRRFGGTGLGLSITKELLRILGGSVEVVSEEGKGSTFTISFPLPQQVEEENTLLPRLFTQEESAVKDDRNNVVAGDRILLIIEDDQDFAEIVKAFGKQYGYKTIIALRGDEGLSFAKKYKPDAIILDMYLPVMDGEMILKKLKGIDELKHIPVHIISASEDNRFVIPGALAYLKKPVKKEDIDKAFSAIAEYHNRSIKKVLIITHDIGDEKKFQQLLGERHRDITYDNVGSFDKAIKQVEKKRYDCIIADIGSNVEEGIRDLQRLNKTVEQQNTPVIVYLNNDLTADNELQLKKVSNVVVRKSNTSSERLMDELELFLYRVNTISFKQQQDELRSDGIDPTLKNKKVLVVDDDMRNVFALSASLEQEHMQVITASDGKEALENLKQHNDVDIVLMDIMMPEMDGYEAMKHIRHNKNWKDLPIIALTAKAMTGDREKCIEAGASDYISKPVDVKKLQSLMRVWLTK
jgi:signal transduction histidine kinase/CheY-like chemotaxis protein/CHASE3 domain sensor protein